MRAGRRRPMAIGATQEAHRSQVAGPAVVEVPEERAWLATFGTSSLSPQRVTNYHGISIPRPSRRFCRILADDPRLSRCPRSALTRARAPSQAPQGQDREACEARTSHEAHAQDEVWFARVAEEVQSWPLPKMTSRSKSAARPADSGQARSRAVVAGGVHRMRSHASTDQTCSTSCSTRAINCGRVPPARALTTLLRSTSGGCAAVQRRRSPNRSGAGAARTAVCVPAMPNC